MYKSFKLTGKQDLTDLLKNPKFENALIGDFDFAAYRYGDSRPEILRHESFQISDGDGDFKINRHCAVNKEMTQTDTDAYKDYSDEALETAIQSARALLETHYGELLQKADEIQMEILYLMMLTRIKEGRRIRPIAHTNNKWVKASTTPDYVESAERSNAVYKMYYRIYRDHNWNTKTCKNEFTGRCRLFWSVSVQSPALGTPVNTIGEQERAFKSEEDMQKYLNGRIKAYDKYFVEVYPPVPKEFLHNFVYAGQMLPGYHEEEEQNS